MSKIRMDIGFFGLAENRYQQKYRQISMRPSGPSSGTSVDRHRLSSSWIDQLSDNSSRALDKLAVGRLNLQKAEKNALKLLLDRLEISY